MFLLDKHLAFLRLSVEGQLPTKSWWVWQQLIKDLGIERKLPQYEGNGLYIELDLGTLERTGNGFSQELLLESADAISLNHYLTVFYSLRREGQDRRRLHQLIYKAIRAKPSGDN